MAKRQKQPKRQKQQEYTVSSIREFIDSLRPRKVVDPLEAEKKQRERQERQVEEEKHRQEWLAQTIAEDRKANRVDPSVVDPDCIPDCDRRGCGQAYIVSCSFVDTITWMQTKHGCVLDTDLAYRTLCRGFYSFFGVECGSLISMKEFVELHKSSLCRLTLRDNRFFPPGFDYCKGLTTWDHLPLAGSPAGKPVALSCVTLGRFLQKLDPEELQTMTNDEIYTRFCDEFADEHILETEKLISIDEFIIRLAATKKFQTARPYGATGMKPRRPEEPVENKQEG